jgi:Tat protein secretion system quality control protein TatD with DNase activity
VVETDSPCLLPVTLLQSAGVVSAHADAGKTANEPAYIPIIVKEVARLRGEEEAAIVEATYRNACRLFRCDSSADSSDSPDAACRAESGDGVIVAGPGK